MSGFKCGKCGHENDSTRVFCQNCGTRLERTEEAPTGPTITPVPVKRKSKPQGPSALALFGQFLKGLVSLAVLGAVIALFIQLGRTPDGIPAPALVNETGATSLVEGIKGFAASPFRRSLDLTQDQINNYLAARLTESSEGRPVQGARFARAFVVLKQGRFQFYVERKYLGLSVYFRLDAEPLSGPEGTTAIVKGAGIGRLQLPPLLVRPVQARIFAPAIEALAEPIEILRKANQVNVQPGVVTLTWIGGRTEG
jgi:hypothetical protein